MNKPKIILEDSSRKDGPRIFYCIKYIDDNCDMNLGYIQDYVSQGSSIFEISLDREPGFGTTEIKDLTKDKEKMTALLEFLSSTDFVDSVTEIADKRGNIKTCEEQLLYLIPKKEFGDRLGIVTIRPDKDRKDSATIPVIKGMDYEDFSRMVEVVDSTKRDLFDESMKISAKHSERTLK